MGILESYSFSVLTNVLGDHSKCVTGDGVFTNPIASNLSELMFKKKTLQSSPCNEISLLLQILQRRNDQLGWSSLWDPPKCYTIFMTLILR